jgi:O-antigen ligase
MTREQVAGWMMKAGCVLFCITLPLSIKLNNLSIALILIGWLTEPYLMNRIRDIPKGILFLPVLFYLWHVFGLTYSSDLGVASSQLERKASIFLLPVSLGTTRLLSGTSLRLVLKAFIFSNLAVAVGCFLFAMVQFNETGNVDYFFYHSLTRVIDLHAIYLALYLGFSILIILYFEYYGSPLFDRRNSLLLILVFLGFIILLSALVIMFILPLLIVFILGGRLMGGWSAYRKALVFGSALALVFLVAFSLPYTRTKMLRLSQISYSMGDSDYQWGSLTIRLAKWECALEVLRHHWIVGVGTGDAQEALMESYRQKGFSEGLRNNYNTHNQYLETWIMLGIPGLVLLIVVLWPWQRNILWVCFLILISISFLTENMLDTQKGVVFFSFFYSLLQLIMRPSSPLKEVPG